MPQNQIENNQRPLIAAVLLKLSAAHDIDLQMLSDDEDDRVAAELHAAMCDSIFQGNMIRHNPYAESARQTISP